MSRPKKERKGAGGLNSQEFNEVLRVQERLARAVVGKAPFEYPGAANGQPHARYQPSRAEEDFMVRSRSKMMGSLLLYSTVGFAVPYMVLRMPVIANNSRVFKRPFIWAFLGGVIGSMTATANMRLHLTRDMMLLEDSPIAKELCFQFWKLNPNHPYLTKFHDDFDEFERYFERREQRQFEDDDDDYGRGHGRGHSQQRGGRRRDDYEEHRYEYDREQHFDERDDDYFDDEMYYDDDRVDDRWHQQRGGKPQTHSQRSRHSQPVAADRDEDFYGDSRSEWKAQQPSFASVPKRRAVPRHGDEGAYDYGRKRDSALAKGDVESERLKKRQRFYNNRQGEWAQSSDGGAAIHSDVDSHLHEMFAPSVSEKKD